MVQPRPLLPDYGGANLANLVPALMSSPGERPGWLPKPARAAEQVVLLVLDGLGWSQLQERKALAPAVASLEGGPITSVVPTTTATALSSLTLGVPPALHGIVGYRVAVSGPAGSPEVLNVLKWRTQSGDARQWVRPREFQQLPAFGGRKVPVVSKAAFGGSGFSEAHQPDVPLVGWEVLSSIAVEVRRLLAQGEPFVYCYYDGLDRVAHMKGLGEHYEAELRAVDRLVGELAGVLGPGAALAVTADHGQVEVGPRASPLDAEVAAEAALVSGEARFRWLHAREGRTGALLEVARDRYNAEAWVLAEDQVEAEGWFGGPLEPRVRARIGDVALVPYEPVGYLGPEEQSEARLVCRHGSLTPDEMLVPLLSTAR